MRLADQRIRRIPNIIINEVRQRVDVFGRWVVDVELGHVVHAGLCFEEIDLHDREFGRIPEKSFPPVERKMFENNPFAFVAGLFVDLADVVVAIVFVARAPLEDAIRSEFHLHQPARLVVRIEGRIARGNAVDQAQARDGFAEDVINKGKTFPFDIVLPARAFDNMAPISHHILLAHDIAVPVLQRSWPVAGIVGERQGVEQPYHVRGQAGLFERRLVAVLAGGQRQHDGCADKRECSANDKPFGDQRTVRHMQETETARQVLHEAWVKVIPHLWESWSREC